TSHFNNVYISAVNSTKAVPPGEDVSSQTWPYMAAVLASALTVSLFIVVAIKCRLFHRYLASYHHSLLPEGDTARRGGNGTHRGLDTDDDDGFIEDNYIQASERARAESHEDEGMEGEVVEDSDDDLQFTIG
uniref:Type III endosome membrane protein TEMP n=1 Tax=Oncorhynchus tshawytscha TaxID=74940 RepID=A0A8C8D4A3_ONCTS